MAIWFHLLNFGLTVLRLSLSDAKEVVKFPVANPANFMAAEAGHRELS